MSHVSRRPTCFAAAMLLCLAGTNFAQEAVTPQAQPLPPAAAAKPEAGTTITVIGGAGYQAEADVDNTDGNFSVQRFGAGLRIKSVLDESFTLRNALDYGYASYDFSDVAAAWSEVQTVNYKLLLDYDAGSDWTFYGGPVIGYAGENGSEFDESFTGGALIGANYHFSPTLTLGLGLLVTSQIEDDGKIAPIPMVNWQIQEDLCLKTIEGRPGLPGNLGIELAWAFAPQWELGGGLMTYSSRFRLSDSGDNADGVGEDTGMPVFVRLGWNPDEQLNLSLIGGSVMGGQIRIENSDGDKVAEEDYDPAAFIGAMVSYRF